MTAEKTTITAGARGLLQRVAPYMAPLSFLVVTLAYGLAFGIHPEHPRLLVTPAFFLLYMLIDRRSIHCASPARLEAARETHFMLRLFMLAMAIIVSGKIIIMLAIDQAVIARDWYFPVSRTFALLVSLSFIVLGNYMPKMPSPWIHREEPFDWQGVHRFTGIVFMITGILMFFAWSILPVPEAKRVTLPLVLIMAVVVVSRKWYSLVTWKGTGLS